MYCVVTHLWICFVFFFFLMIRRPPRSTHCISSAASDVYKRQYQRRVHGGLQSMIQDQQQYLPYQSNSKYRSEIQPDFAQQQNLSKQSANQNNSTMTFAQLQSKNEPSQKLSEAKQPEEKVEQQPQNITQNQLSEQINVNVNVNDQPKQTFNQHMPNINSSQLQNQQNLQEKFNQQSNLLVDQSSQLQQQQQQQQKQTMQTLNTQQSYNQLPSTTNIDLNQLNEVKKKFLMVAHCNEKIFFKHRKQYSQSYYGAL
eukprot:TRINITY_DN2425_c0_g1_i1.p1 TRINITY_DN2425_c0_g1~~TRINITY_DN2425_c0_g1_i1.p1  ORF type:complete len:255 (-),score=60.95 TRINITY_DN2425_c0_g1_i1:302-1066(-)